MTLRQIATPSVLVLPLFMLGGTCGPTSTSNAAGVRFVLSTRSDVQQPVYVQVTGMDNQPGWIQVSRASERLFIRERCEIADCGQSPAVCGAAIPVVRDIASASASRSIELAWDGMMSFVDPSKACETRQPAPAGDYVAQFCFGRRAQVAANANAARDVQGTVLEPTCRDVRFSLPGAGDVIFEITNSAF